MDSPAAGRGHSAEDAIVGRRVGDPPASAGEQFDSLRIALLSRIAREDFPGLENVFFEAADIWGYVSPSGREYALMGLNASVAFVDVTDPVNPVIVGSIEGPGSIWRDMRVYQSYAYIVIDSTGLGLQVVDLTGIDDGVVTLVTTSNDRGFFTAHNIVVNRDSGYAYTVGGNTDLGGLTPWDLSDPANPAALPGWHESYVHDAQVVTYTQGEYAGREIAFAFAGYNGLKIVDVTDKSNMFTIAERSYPNLSYCHQGRLSEDRRYLFIDDELDELSFPSLPTTTYVFDVSRPDDPQYVTSYTNGVSSTDHNLMVRGRFVFAANYTSGLRVFDTCDINNVVEVGYFDTFPEFDQPSWGFEGAWGVFTDFPSGIVVVSDRQRGLFVFDTSEAEAVPPALPECEADPCGNGVVDTGETCDIGIAKGDPGACPTTCDDQDPCTTDTLNDGGTCVAACTFTPVTIPADDDGCCPAGADANNDNDCVPLCGNGACEPGEGPVQCSADCPCSDNAACDDGGACTFDLCAAGACSNVEAMYGDLAGAGGTCGPDAQVDIFDIFAMLDAFQGVFSDGCSTYNMDIAACARDGQIDILDIFAVLDAFQGIDPCCGR